MNDELKDLKLGVGVASFRHDAHLSRTLESVDAVLNDVGIKPVMKVLVSAEGSSAAERLAAQKGWASKRVIAGSPRTLAAAREAARRAAGGAVTLLVDGDVAMSPGWLGEAIRSLATDERLAGIGGVVDEAHWRGGALVGGRRDTYGAGAGGPGKLPRDIGLWQREALDHVGGFDVWLPSEDEAELGGRLLLSGYRYEVLGQVAGVRNGPARDSLAEVREYLSTGRVRGPGLVLRRSRGTMLFSRHLNRYRNGLLLLVWVVLGLLLLLFSRERFWIWVWATLGGLVFASILRMSMGRAFWGAVLSLIRAVGVVRALVPTDSSRLGPPPKPVPPPKEADTGPGSPEAEEARRKREEADAREIEALRDPDEPPPIVGRDPNLRLND